LNGAPQARSEFYGGYPKLRSTPSLLTFLRGQESQSPAGASPGQQTNNQKRKLLPHTTISFQRKKAKKLINKSATSYKKHN
jgi:hypothetical protein